MQCALALIVHSVELSTDIEQLGDVLLLPGGGCTKQRRPSHRVARLQLRLVPEQQLQNAEVV